MKSDEQKFLLAVLDKVQSESVRDVIARVEIPEKRCWYYLNKWISKRWYEYGVNLEMGWLTPEGKEASTKLRDHQRALHATA